ncbi:Zinc finger, CCHC-type [Balamuthia mandrillaris]
MLTQEKGCGPKKQPNGSAYTSSSSSSTSSSPSGASSSGPSPATKSKSHITYYNCNQKGHYSNECPLPKKKPPASLNSLDNLTPTPPAQPSGDSLSALHTDDLYEEYNHAINELQADSLFQLDANNDNSSFDKIRVPALINNHPVSAFLDTGTSHSFIDLETAKKFHIRFHPLKSSVTLGANNSVAEAHSVALSVSVACGKLHFRHHFHILSLS